MAEMINTITDQNQVRVHLKGADTQSYHEAFKEAIGGEINDNIYELKQGRTSVRSVYYTIAPGFELSISNSIYPKNVEVIKHSNNNPDIFYFSLINDGSIKHSFNNKEKTFEASSTAGVFINNGLFPVKAYIPAKKKLKSVDFKVTRQALEKMIPESVDIVQTLFRNNEPKGYHTSLPIELNTLLEDMFRFKKSEFGKKPLVMARGLELFTLLIRSVRNLVGQKELNGLHIDDHRRILKIKERLLSSFHEKIIVEKIAVEHGISESKLKRDFKALFNNSVYQFYTEAKMNEAFHRLKSGKYTVMEVGYDLGYNSLSKFSQMFKKLKGINPSEVMPV